MIKKLASGLVLALAFSANAMAENSKETKTNEAAVSEYKIVKADKSVAVSPRYTPPVSSSALPAAASKKGGVIAGVSTPVLVAGLGMLIAVGIIIADDDKPNSP